MSFCPVCQKPVDPLRARAVGVRDGKIVAFCSTDCQRKAEGKPAVVEDAGVRVTVRTPPKGTPVVTPPKGTPVVTPTLDSGPVIEIIRETSAPVEPATKSDSKPVRAKTEPPVRAKSEPPVRAKSDPALEPVKPAPEPVKLAPEPKPEARRDASEVSRKTPGGGTRLPTAPIQPPPDYDDDDLGPPQPARSRTPLVVIAVLVVAAAGLLVAVKLMQKSHANTAAVPAPGTRPPPEPPPPPPAPAPPPVGRDAALAQAHDLLVAQLKSDSPRVQRRAAEALARTGDKPALEVLQALLVKETANEIARVDLAYALARGGDKRGADALVTALGSRRDVRAEAANRLALLGDARATPVLADYLDVSQLRLGAAEHLAHLAEPRAIKVLEATRADDKATTDDKARAAIALGMAGKADVAPALHELLAAKGWNASAAIALAHLHDASARPVLVEQLAISQLRVEAAGALRKLEPGLDPAPLLPPLLADLASAKDTAQIEAAETILLLTGPASWSDK